MAHATDKLAAVRAAYVTRRLPIAPAARLAGVPESTARSWKSRAEQAGDDWDRAREAAALAAGGLGPTTERVLSDFASLFSSTMERLQSTPGNPIETAQAVASLSDAYAKTVKAAGCVDPKLARLSIALEVLERLGKYIREERPDLAAGLLEILEPFGAVLSAELG